MKVVLRVVFLVFSCVSAAKLPSYITPCKRSAIDLNECAARNGQAALSTLVRGDKAYRIPNMLPLKIDHIEIEASRTLKISAKNAEIFGLETAEIREVKIDLNAQHLRFVVYIPRATLIGTYNVNGRILILPIQGNGPCNITLVGGTFNYEIDYELQDRKGEQYVNILKSEINYETQKLYFQLENLFNGDKRLGAQMNSFLNENWKEVSKDVGPALTETVSQIITQILSAILKKVPYDELLPV